MAAVAVGQHLEEIGAFPGADMGDRLARRRIDRLDVHAIDLPAGDAPGLAVAREVLRGRGAIDRGAHAVFVVLDDVEDGELHQRGEVEALIDLALVGGALAEIGGADAAVVAVVVGEGEAGADAHLGADDAVPAEEVLFAREHVHRAALAVRVAVAPAGEFGHHPLGVHADGEHMAVVAIAGDDLIALLKRKLHAGDHRLLADIEVAEAADQTHAVELAGAFLEAPDEHHHFIGAQQPVLAERRVAGVGGCGGRGGGLGRFCHRGPPSTGTAFIPRRPHS